MTPELALLNEVWDTVKSYVPKKERVVVAEEILRNFEEHLDISELEVYKNEFDSAMKAAIVDTLDLEEDDEELDDWE